MSRAASKSRADKARGTTSTPATQQAVSQDAVDIIPGRLTQSFWMAMVAQEEGEEVVRDILDDLMSHVMKKCKTAYLKQQLIPYTVARTREMLLEILECRFLVQDPGEPSDSTWKEDSEPEPLLTDSWAQGCVSIAQRKPTPPPQPRTPITNKQARRGSQNANTDESQHKASGARKKQKDPKACREIKSGPAKSQTEKKGVSPAVTSDISEKNNLQPAASGIPQTTRKPNTHSHANSMPQHVDRSTGGEGHWNMCLLPQPFERSPYPTTIS
ncbi:hypothetical protein ACEWY4_011659 [Coilia grayii]|uniref:Uncharacterized protein n=1 Tax=Coilia grayii TaxID=363190 RepID=A0ABD1JYF6_9TELE